MPEPGVLAAPPSRRGLVAGQEGACSGPADCEMPAPRALMTQNPVGCANSVPPANPHVASHLHHVSPPQGRTPTLPQCACANVERRRVLSLSIGGDWETIDV